jgi:hypothetical protein
VTQIYLIKRIKPVGQIIITVDERGKKLFSLELDKNPDEIANMRSILFKVVNLLEDDSD